MEKLQKHTISSEKKQAKNKFDSSLRNILHSIFAIGLTLKVTLLLTN